MVSVGIGVGARAFGHEWGHRTLINTVNETGWPLANYFVKLCSEDDLSRDGNGVVLETPAPGDVR